MASFTGSDRDQKKKRIITLVLLAIFLMSVSFFLVDRKDGDHHHRLFPERP